MVQTKKTVSAVYQKPFLNLIAIVKKNGDWLTNPVENARVFHLERKRLGNDFTLELIKFIVNDVDRHYAAALFLSEPSYLENNKPMNQLALLIFLQGIPLTKKNSNFLIQCQEVSFRVYVVLLAHRMGYKTLAVYYKTIARNLMKKKLYSGGFPAMTDADLKIYKSIKTEKRYLKK
jgi:hypothetical protein